MASGKALKKSFYTESEAGNTNIAMPSAGEPSSMTMDQPTQASSTNNSLGSVPDSVPEEVYKEMNEQENTQQNLEEVGQSEEHEVSEETHQEESSQEDSQEEDQQSQEVKPSPQESFKAIREAKEKAERERDMIMQQMMEYQKQRESLEKQNKAPEPPPIDDDIDFNIQEDDIVEGRYVKKVTNKIKNLEKQLQAYENYNKQQSIESKIKEQFPDFDKVVSEQNVQMLNNQFPEVARTLGDNQDLYSKAVSAYNVMKKFGIYREDPHAEERIRAMKNTQKPRTVTSVNPQQGDSPLSKANAFANGLTEDLKEQLRKEMLAARKSM